ncbi:MAG: ABC transporter ATP-binding protein, partial [Candidatus Binatia bacterium]
MSHFAIRVQGLGKQYRLGQRHPALALRDTLEDILRAPLRGLLSITGHSSSTTKGRESASGPSLWALKDVTFTVQRGEAVGIIGHNGAGKSALLRILARITKPTEGSAELHGQVRSILEVGTGFHPELTGRENVFLSGAVLGMKKAEITRQFDAIVAFAEVEPFIDTPVKRYSSGMRARLTFAVAAYLEADILLIDEVLATQDVGFQDKCLRKIRELMAEGRTVLFVSHNMDTIESLCPRALFLDHGRLLADGAVRPVIQCYLDHLHSQERVERSRT